MTDDLPPGIGPHELRELDLMLAGSKPLAMFNDDWPEDLEKPEIAFDAYVAEGRFVKGEYRVPAAEFPGGRLRYYFYALPGEAWRIGRMIELQRARYEQGAPATRESEAEIGRLLGYADGDIRVCVNRFFDARRRGRR